MKKLAGLEITNSQYQYIVDILTGKKDDEEKISVIYTEDLYKERPRIRILTAIKHLMNLGKGRCGYHNRLTCYLLGLKDCRDAIIELSTKLNKS